MMQASILWFRDPQNIGLHPKILDICEIMLQAYIILEISEIYDAGQYSWDLEARRYWPAS